MGEELPQQLIIDAFVVNNAVSRKIKIFSTGGNLETPLLVYFLQTRGDGPHACLVKFAVVGKPAGD